MIDWILNAPRPYSTKTSPRTTLRKGTYVYLKHQKILETTLSTESNDYLQNQFFQFTQHLYCLSVLCRFIVLVFIFQFNTVLRNSYRDSFKIFATLLQSLLNSSTYNFGKAAPFSNWLIFCCENLILHQKKECK